MTVHQPPDNLAQGEGEAMCTEPESKAVEPPASVVYGRDIYLEFLAAAAWSLGTRCEVLARFAELGDDPGCHYAARQIAAEAEAILQAAVQLRILSREK